MRPPYNGPWSVTGKRILSNFRLQKFNSGPAIPGVRPLAWLRALGHAFPQRCALCAAASGDNLLCAGCDQSLPELGEACPRCALPTPSGVVCGACLQRPPPQLRTVAALVYAFPVNRLLQDLKFGQRLALAEPLAARLARAVACRYPAGDLPEYIVPLPLSRARQRSRGFNQAAELARALGWRMNRPVKHVLQRNIDAPPQAGLPRRDRVRNVRGVFGAARPVEDLHLALLDDVMTTGATLAAAAGALLRAGAASVDAWVIARALPPGQG